jgi:hypothetical protein
MNYKLPQEYDELTNQQVLTMQHNKIRQQESELTEIIGNTKKGRQHARELNEELLTHNIILGHVETDVR